MLSAAPELKLRGTLQETSLPELLIYALDHNVEGTLILQTKDGKKNAIYFLRGAPAKVRLAEPAIFLSEVLVDLGLLAQDVALQSQKKATELGLNHGEVLRQKGLIDETALYLALREQVQRQTLALCELPQDTGFGFYNVNFLAKWGPPGEWRAKPLPLVWRALADHLPGEKVEAVKLRLGSQVLRMRTEAPVARYRMNREEQAAIMLLRAQPQERAQLRGSGVGTEEGIDRTVAALYLSRQLEGEMAHQDPVGFTEPPESPHSLPPPGTSRSTTAPRPKGLRPTEAPPLSTKAPPPSRLPSARSVTPPPAAAGSPEVARLRAEISDRGDTSKLSYYELFEVPADADASVIRGAYFRLARKWHPDKLPAELEDLRPQVTSTFARMSEAHQVLTDGDRRKEYDQLLEGKGLDEAAQVAEILGASAAFQRAEVLMKKRDYAAALLEAKSAYEADPQADYMALYAWLESMNRTTDEADLIALLDRAVQQEANNVRALWYRGQLLKKAGKVMAAIRDFRAIVQLKPSHVDAAREIRVYEMRKRTDGAGAGRQGSDTGRSTTEPRRPGSGTGPNRDGRDSGRQSKDAGRDTGPQGLLGRFLKRD